MCVNESDIIVQMSLCFFSKRKNSFRLVNWSDIAFLLKDA